MRVKIVSQMIINIEKEERVAVVCEVLDTIIYKKIFQIFDWDD